MRLAQLPSWTMLDERFHVFHLFDVMRGRRRFLFYVDGRLGQDIDEQISRDKTHHIGLIDWQRTFI